MKIHVEGRPEDPVSSEPRVGNAYPLRAGRGASRGWMHVIIAITEPKSPYDLCGPSVLMLTVDRDGDPVNVTRYGLHHVRELTPVAFVEGLDQLQLSMRPL